MYRPQKLNSKYIMKVLITGSSGYLGSLLVNFLVSEKIAVVGIDNRKSEALPPGDFFKFYLCSITDKAVLEEIFLREQPTHVVHFACTFNKVRDRKKELFIDIGGSENILNVSNRTLSVVQIVHSSSAAAYGGWMDNPEWINETHSLRPGKYRYGMNKKAIEQIYLSATVRDNLRIVILRICTVTGPFFTSDRIILRLLTRFPFLPGFCKDCKIQLLHEDDFVSLLHKVINDGLIEGVYNLAPDSFAAVRDIATDKKYFMFPAGVIKSILWVLWNLKVLNLQPAGINNSIYPIILDPAKLQSRYSYKFRYTTTEALAATPHKKKH